MLGKKSHGNKVPSFRKKEKNSFSGSGKGPSGISKESVNSEILPSDASS